MKVYYNNYAIVPVIDTHVIRKNVRNIHEVNENECVIRFMSSFTELPWKKYTTFVFFRPEIVHRFGRINGEASSILDSEESLKLHTKQAPYFEKAKCSQLSKLGRQIYFKKK